MYDIFNRLKEAKPNFKGIKEHFQKGLKKLDKEVTVVCCDNVPELYSFLPSINVVGNKLVSSNNFIITIFNSF